MTVPETELALHLHRAGQSFTLARKTIFAALQGQEPLTMAALIARCPNIDRASVYRTVSLFERLGVLQRLQHGWKYKVELSDAFHTHHHHATCLRCGMSIPLPFDGSLEAILHNLAAEHGFHLQQHQLELQGVCSACRHSHLPVA